MAALIDDSGKPGWKYYRFYGQIDKLFPHSVGCYVRIRPREDLKAEYEEFRQKNNGPNPNYFLLGLEHPNYNSIYSLLLTSAFNDQEVEFRLNSFQDGNSPSTIINYIVQNWER